MPYYVREGEWVLLRMGVVANGCCCFGARRWPVFRWQKLLVRLFWYQISLERVFVFRLSSAVRDYGIQNSAFTRAFH